MGCNESREKPDSSPAAFSARSFGDERDSLDEAAPLILSLFPDTLPTSADMGQPGQSQYSQAAQQQQPLFRLPSLSRQHERLVLELFSFKDSRQFHEWLAGPFVRGSWLEFRRDSARLRGDPGQGSGSGPDDLAEVDKAKASQLAKDAINGSNVKYLAYYPDKAGWTLSDHVVRFIVTVVSDNILKGLWSKADWSRRSLDIAKSVYEVLIFLRSIDPASEPNPPGYSV